LDETLWLPWKALFVRPTDLLFFQAMKCEKMILEFSVFFLKICLYYVSENELWIFFLEKMGKAERVL